MTAVGGSLSLFITNNEGKSSGFLLLTEKNKICIHSYFFIDFKKYVFIFVSAGVFVPGHRFL